MNTQNGNKTKQAARRPFFACAATIDGHDITVTGKTLKSAKWSDHHGNTANGAKVMSLRSTSIGNTVIIQKPDGSKSGYKRDDMEVFARDLLSGLGYAVTAPGQNGA